MNITISDNLIQLPLEKALFKHKKLVEKFIWLLRNSETEMADYPLNDIGWFYSFVFKRNEIIFNKDLYDKLRKMGIEERLKEELKHLEVSLCMITPTFSLLNRLPEIPQEVNDLFKKTVIQRMSIEKFFDFKGNSNISYPTTMDIWDESILDLSIDELKEKLQQAIETENYEDAAKIQKQIDNKN